MTYMMNAPGRKWTRVLVKVAEARLPIVWSTLKLSKVHMVRKMTAATYKQ